MYYVYVLENNKGRHYIGSCVNVEERLKRHNQNSVRSTKNKGPFTIAYQKEFSTRREARIRENQIKRYKNSGYLRRLINRQDPIV
ncbi:MAG: GIY-YIG nuclease family protein [Candidatus Omnitrophota bacterium]